MSSSELELLPGLRLLPAPGHTRGLHEPSTDGQLTVRALDPELVWLAHEHAPWRRATG
jgi:N-acyl homoserine lactone hydrolase